MRPIKFRAWHKYKKVMLTVEAINFEARFIEHAESWRHEDNPEATSDHYSNFDEIMLMQFTGILDCKGNEIYEGDIVILPDHESHYVDVGFGEMCGQKVEVAETPVNSIGEVSFENYTLGIHIAQGGDCLKEGEFYTFADINEMYEQAEIEIIGNFYENPDLITR